MKRLLLLLFILFSPALRAQQEPGPVAGPDIVWGEDETVVFTPVYGSDSQLNDLLTFVSNWVVVRIPYNEEIHRVNGVIHCRFTMDTTGKIINVRMSKNQWAWMSYSIAAALKNMPPYDAPLTRGRNFSHDLYFTFGDRGNNLPGFSSGDWESAQHARGMEDLQGQKEKEGKKIKAHYKRFEKFRKENMVEGMTQEMRKATMPDQGHLDPIVPQEPLPPPSGPIRTETRIQVTIE